LVLPRFPLPANAGDPAVANKAIPIRAERNPLVRDFGVSCVMWFFIGIFFVVALFFPAPLWWQKVRDRLVGGMTGVAATRRCAWLIVRVH